MSSGPNPNYTKAPPRNIIQKSTIENGHSPSTPIKNLIRQRRGHERSYSDVTQIRFSQRTNQSGQFAVRERTNSLEDGKKSFLGDLANKVKGAFEGKKEQELTHKSSNSALVPMRPRRALSPLISRKTFPPPSKVAINVQDAEICDVITHVTSDNPPSIISRLLSSLPVSGATLAPPVTISSRPSSPELQREQSSDFKDIEKAREAFIKRNHSSPVMGKPHQCSCDVTTFPVTSSATNSKSNDINLVVMGAEGVGKSALIVRYLTKRFIGEYAPNVETIYDQTITLEGRDVTLHIWDSEIPTILQKPSDVSDRQTDELKQEMRDDPVMTSQRWSVTSLRSTTSSSSSHGSRISISSIEEQKIFDMSDCLPTLPDTSDTTDTFSEHSDKPVCKTKRKSVRRRREDEQNNNGLTLKCPEDDLNALLQWCDGVVVIYSICDSESFESARDVVRYLRGQYVRGHAVSDLVPSIRTRKSSSSSESSANSMSNRLSQIPILLIGNKVDLEHRRRVQTHALYAFAGAYSCKAVELSVSDGYDEVYKAFQEILDTVRKNKVPPPNKMKRIKSIVRTVSGTFGHRRNVSM